MRTFLLLLFCFLSIGCFAQQDSLKHTTTTAALMYNSNISYYGQATTAKYPFVLANLTVRFPFHLYLSAGAYQLLNEGSSLSESDLGIGYEYQLSDPWTVGLSYSRSFFPANSPLLAAANENNLNISSAYDGTLLKSALSADYAFGSQQDLFISLTNSKIIDLGTFLSEKNAISIEPAIEIVAGTRHFYETFVIEQEKRNNGKGKGAINQPTQITSTTTASERNTFNLLSYNFKLPLSLSRANYLVEASYQFSVLGKKADENLRSHYAIYGLSFYYQF